MAAAATGKREAMRWQASSMFGVSHGAVSAPVPAGGSVLVMPAPGGWEASCADDTGARVVLLTGQSSRRAAVAIVESRAAELSPALLHGIT